MMDFLPEERMEERDALDRVSAGEKIDAVMVPTVVAPAVTVERYGASEATVREMAAALGGQIGALAEMLRITNERMAEMEKVIRTLEKVTPQQANNINKAIRERAAEICREYRIAAGEARRETAVAIRRDVRGATGARSMQAVARCDYAAVIEMVSDWDDYEKMKAIKKGAGTGE